MLARDLISEVIPFLRTSDTGMKALTWMEIFRISHLPIVNNEELLGLISDTDIYDLNMADEAIGNHNLSLIRPYVFDNQHVYEVIETVSRLKLTVVPVLDEKKRYLGVITLFELLEQFAKLTALQQPGAIIVLEMHQRDYSLSQIAQIVESNDIRILSMYIEPQNDSMRIDVIIKLNKDELSGLLQTFERYDYQVKAIYKGESMLDSLYENRFEEFLNYLNI